MAMEPTPRPASSTAHGTVDAHGSPVTAGTRVRVLAIDGSLLAELEPQARERVRSMRGQCLKVYEVDCHGCAWVEQWWQESEDEATSHSLALQSPQMEIC